MSRSRGFSAASQDRRPGDLVEDHPLDRYARLEGFQQVPGDGLALAVTIRGQIELVDVLEQPLQLADRALLLWADDVERLEVGVDVDSKSCPRLRLELRGHVGRRARQVADVPPGGFDDVAGAQITGQFARLGGRLDYDQSPVTSISLHIWVSQLRLRSIPMPVPKRDRPAGRMTGRPLKVRAFPGEFQVRRRTARLWASDNFAPLGALSQTGSREWGPPCAARPGARATTPRGRRGVPPRSLPVAIASDGH